MIKKKNSGFTLIELLVVISIIGILMGIVGPKVFDLLSSSKATKTQAVFRSWVTQLYQYQQFYKYFPPFLLDDKQEGESYDLSENQYHDSFIAAMRGMSWNVDSLMWEDLTDELLEQNPKRREFHAFTEDEFGEDGYLADSWGGRKIRIVVDHDGDGLIRLSEDDLSSIIDSLKTDYDAETLENARDRLAVIRDKVGIFVLFDSSGETESQNVFSWDVTKYLDSN